MARREIFVDDLDGKEHDSVQTRRYSIGRQAYTIDLSDENYEQFLNDVKKYVDVSVKEEAPARSLRAPEGRKTIKSSVTRTAAKGEPSRAAQIREWAAKEGIEVSSRGRIHKDVIEKYEYAMESERKGDPA